MNGRVPDGGHKLIDESAVIRYIQPSVKYSAIFHHLF